MLRKSEAKNSTSTVATALANRLMQLLTIASMVSGVLVWFVAEEQ